MGSPMRRWASARRESSQIESELAQTSISARVPTGFVLVDSSLRITHCNSVALEIFGYPEMTLAYEKLNSFISGIFGSLVKHRESCELSFITEFVSGRRQYVCRAYSLGHSQPGLPDEQIAVVLERSASIFSGLTQVCSHFGLTPRESQALRLVLRGFSTKEMASEMKVSPYTVQAFIRSITIKMAASTRARIVAKALNCLEALREQEPTVSLLDALGDVSSPHGASGSPRVHARSRKHRMSSLPPPGNGVPAAPSCSKLEIAETKAEDQEPNRCAARLWLPESSDTSMVLEEWRDRFTPKELRILALLVQGRTSAEIAIQLDAPERTVKNYLRALVSTTRSSDLTELVEFILAQRVLEPSAKEY